MMEAVPRGALSGDFVLHRNRRPIATLDVSAWRERAEIEIYGERYTFRRERVLGGAFLLERGDQVIARANKPSALRSVLELEIDGRTYTFRRRSWLSREFALFIGRQRVGGVSPTAWYARRSVIRVPLDWHPALQAFLFWLALTMEAK
jgi:hypothetical protein